jgi:hypothetical protein
MYHIEYMAYGTITDLQNTLHRASIIQHGRYIEVISTADNSQNEPPETAPFLWRHITATKASIIQKIEDLLKHVYLETSDNLDRLLQDFNTGQTVAVSDGSFFPETGASAAAWIIESKCQTQWIRGSLLTPGPIQDFSAYRSELTGLLASSVTLKILASCTRSPNHTIIGCDGKAALQVLTLSKEELSANFKHADILSIIVDIWASSTTQPFPVHIRGHQDTRQDKPLSRLEILNILMDKLATLTAASIYNPGDPLPITSLGFPRVKLQNKVISGEMYTSLYNGLGELKIDEYFNKQPLGGRITMDCIATRSFSLARSHAPTFLNIFITKWLSNTIATGMVMQQRKHRIFNRCPRCNAWGEDRLHLVICWDARAKVIWNKQMDIFQDLLHKEQTCPEIAHFLMNGLRDFRAKPNSPQVTQVPWQREIIQIGWVNVLSGFLGKQLIDYQSQYYKSLGSRKTGVRWGSRIIMHWWILIHKMWLGRNDVLHKKEVINSLSGQCLLDIEIEREYEAGYEGLPEVVHKWFQQPKEELLDKSIEYKKGWLLIVKTIKDSLQIAEYSIFTSSKALRRWIGLQNK